MQETRVPSLVREDLLKKEMATHSSILAWKNPINRGAKRATVYGVAESDTTERLSTNMPFYMRDFTLRFWYLWGSGARPQGSKGQLYLIHGHIYMF